jgi:dTDP-4-dehydrorhamnose reductase
VRILLTGKNGQVGRELQRALAPLGERVAYGRQEADFTDLARLEGAVRQAAPEVIVNAAAYTAVDRAETDRATAHRVNAEAVEVLARHAARHGGWLVHYSTEYVFDGTSATPYREDDAPGPLNVYGASKLAGEAAVRKSGCRHLIFRTSWVYGADGGSFMRAILERARERETLEVAADQTGAPTGARLVAEVTATCLERVIAGDARNAPVSGTYHLAAAGAVTRHAWARYLVEESIRLGARLKARPEGVLPIPASAYPSAARRPASSLLDTRKLQAAFGLVLPHWEPGVRAVAPALIGQT